MEAVAGPWGLWTQLPASDEKSWGSCEPEQGFGGRRPRAVAADLGVDPALWVGVGVLISYCKWDIESKHLILCSCQVSTFPEK